MKILLKLLCTSKFQEDTAVPLEFNFELQERVISDIFNTEWYELGAFDFLSYEAVQSEYDYLKLYLQDVVVYSGKVLTVHELQCKLKHLTRVDQKKIK